MKKILTLLFISIFVAAINAQTPTPTPASSAGSSDVGIKPNLAGGEVKAINSTDNKITLATKDGMIEIVIPATAAFKRVPPENPVLKAAVASSLAELGQGDKILVTGMAASDNKTFTAKTIYLMTKSDITKKNAAERELWKTRGVSGKVLSVDFKTKQVTLSTRTAAGESKVVISPKDDAKFKRYAPDSIKYADAVDSSLAEIKVGDQLRALGDKSEDGLSFKAEEYVSGSFKMVAGKITAIDITKNEITIEDSATKKPVIVSMNSTSIAKRFPAEMAQMMAMQSMGGAMMRPGGFGQGGQRGQGQGGQAGQGGMRPGGGQPTGQTPTAGTGTQVVVVAGNGQTPPAGTPGAGRPGGMGRGGRTGELDDILERLPNISITDLKVGDTIGVSSTAGAAANRYTAIKLVAGVEPFLLAAQMPSMGGGNGGQGAPSLNIPGLDDFGN